MTDKILYGEYEPSEHDIVIEGSRLICTCGACPEQYDVFDDLSRVQIGYLRLRHGYFRADYPACGGKTVYEADTEGDGVFDDDERMTHLTAANRALRKAHVEAINE